MTQKRSMDSLLRKLKAIVHDAANPFEASVARRKLKLLIEHEGLTLDDLEAEEVGLWPVGYQNAHERLLIQQIARLVTRDQDMIAYVRRGLHKKLLFRVTPAQHLQICYLRDAYRPALKEALLDTVLAFCIANDIRGPARASSDDEPLDSDQEAMLRRANQMAAGIDPTQVRRAIEA